MDKYLELLPKTIHFNNISTARFYNVANKTLLGENGKEDFPMLPEDWKILLSHCNKKTGWESSDNNTTILLFNFHEHHFINPKAEIETACWASFQLLSKLFRERMPNIVKIK